MDNIQPISCEQCSTTGACPFAFTEKSEQAQNYGCLPEPFDIIKMRQKHGKTWACHENPDKPCLGAINYMKKKGLEYKVVDKNLVTESDDWRPFIK